jgi:hypothetical protein
VSGYVIIWFDENWKVFKKGRSRISGDKARRIYN